MRIKEKVGLNSFNLLISSSKMVYESLFETSCDFSDKVVRINVSKYIGIDGATSEPFINIRLFDKVNGFEIPSRNGICLSIDEMKEYIPRIKDSYGKENYFRTEKKGRRFSFEVGHHLFSLQMIKPNGKFQQLESVRSVLEAILDKLDEHWLNICSLTNSRMGCDVVDSTS